MDTIRYEVLAWMKLSGQEEQTASAWYRGAGWYMNRRDGSGTVTTCELIAPADSGSAAGALGALNTCGREGWDVAAFVSGAAPQNALGPTPAALLSDAVGKLLIRGIAGDVTPAGDYFILKRPIPT
jgi:hypothetical protein